MSASESELGLRSPQQGFSPERDGVAGIYVGAALGTAFAGGLFPGAVFLTMVATGIVAGHPQFSYQRVLNDIGDAVVALLGSFIIGFLIAALAALCVFPLVGVLDWVASLRRWRGMLLSCAGGWCGFASVAALAQFEHDGEPLMFALGAMLVGQIGAGRAVRHWRRIEAGAAAPRKTQLPLRQLFGITTAVAIAAAVLAALPVPSRTYAAMGLAAACQAAVVSAWLLVRRFRGCASEDALLTLPQADVPRETIGATPLD
jgi:hypothetical protein